MKMLVFFVLVTEMIALSFTGAQPLPCSVDPGSVCPEAFCSGDVVTYKCNVSEALGTTQWTFPEGHCDSESIIRLTQEAGCSNVSGSCGPFVAANQPANAAGECLVSTLTVTASHNISNSLIQCSNDPPGSPAPVLVGSATLLVAAPPSVSNVSAASCTADSVTVVWEDTSVIPTRYVLSATPPVLNCEPNCTVSSPTMEYTLTGLEGGVSYSVAVQADNCNGQQQGDEYVMDILLTAVGNLSLTTCPIYDGVNNILETLEVTWNNLNPVVLQPGGMTCASVVEYELSISSGSSSFSCTVLPSECVSGQCSHNINVYEGTPSSYNVMVTAIGLNVIENSAISNDVLMVEVSATSPPVMATCSFLSGLSGDALCRVDFTGPDGVTYTSVSTERGSAGESVTVELTLDGSALLPSTTYSYWAALEAPSIESLCVRIAGQFSTNDHVAANLSVLASVITASVMMGILMLCVMSAVIIVFCVVKKKHCSPCRYSPDYKMITRGSEYSFEDQEDIYYVFPLRTLSNSENTSDSMSLQQDLPPRPRSKSSDYRDTVHIPEQVQVTDGQEPLPEPVSDEELGISFSDCFMVCAETTFHITSTSAQCCSWTGYGFRLHFPEQTVSADQMPCSLHVLTSLPSVDQFILPPDSVPVSSFYDVTGPLLAKPLTMEIEHCAKQSHYTTLSFVISREDNPFKFDFLDGGSFPEDSSYGSVSVLHFTKFGIVAKKLIKIKQRILHGGESVEPARSSASNISEVSTAEEFGRSYCARVFHRALKRGKLWYFAITFNLEVCKTFLTKTYQDQNAEPGPDQPVEFEESMIEFIPEGSDFERNDFSVCTNGWKISAPFYPGITKKEVDQFACGKRIPSCQLQAEWSKTEEQPVNKLSQSVTMKGAKKPYNFFKIEYDPTSQAYLAKLTLPETSMATKTTFCKACNCHTVHQENPGTFCIDGFLTEWERKIYDEKTLDVLKKFCTDVGKAFVLDQKQHFRAVRSALVAVAEKWDKIGSALQLQRSKLRSIKSDNHSRVDACLNAMIAQWFAETSTSGPPTLRRLIGAIATKVGGQNPAHAEFVAANFNKTDDMEKLPITGVNSNVLTADDHYTEVCANLVNEGLEHKFMEIGIFLGIDYKKLDGLKDIYEMIDLWLEKSYNTELFGEPSWLNLVKAVGSKVGAGDMSSGERIAHQHGYTTS